MGNVDSTPTERATGNELGKIDVGLQRFAASEGRGAIDEQHELRGRRGGEGYASAGIIVNVRPRLSG